MPGIGGGAEWPFAVELTRCAESTRLAGLWPIVERVRREVRVAVVGRRGLGRRTVEAALVAHGVRVAPDDVAEIGVLVAAEVWKPEDAELLAAAATPTVVVLTKADLIGRSPAGPLATAARRAQEIAAQTGCPAVPMVGLLATAALDDELLVALRTLSSVPADLSSVDAFVGADHPVARDVRVRLLDRLDRFGIAHGVLALSNGADDVGARFRQLSNVAAVLAALQAEVAAVRYARVARAVAELRCLAACLDDERIWRFLAADATVLARLAAAVDVVEAVGLDVGPGDLHRRAVRWRRYAAGPVNALHRAAGADIARGALRQLRAAGR